MERTLEKTFLPPEYDFSDNVIFRSGRPVGYFSLLPYSDGTVYFYNFHIFDRGKGIGTRVFPHILSHLSENYKKIRLQVSGSNPAALRLYKKNGFKIIEEVRL